ncbi:Hypothetical predicted protein [Podarcis lilfordi]|uniref:Uncharacterized protein n=1 Tax=Podarcis lilfordi TaxID=74358 RepID=A0AA35L913_9SAUR|nr:Hypothetical predicted protein [Podarcis lilfordi]
MFTPLVSCGGFGAGGIERKWMGGILGPPCPPTAPKENKEGKSRSLSSLKLTAVAREDGGCEGAGGDLHDVGGLHVTKSSHRQAVKTSERSRRAAGQLTVGQRKRLDNLARISSTWPWLSSSELVFSRTGERDCRRSGSSGGVGSCKRGECLVSLTTPSVPPQQTKE